MVVNDPRNAGSLEGRGTMSWGGAAGAWFGGDRTNDVVFVGMIQRYGGTGGVGRSPGSNGARALTFEALHAPFRPRFSEP